MDIDSRNSVLTLFRYQIKIWQQIFFENLSISIAMYIVQIQIYVNLNLYKPILSACRNVENVSTQMVIISYLITKGNSYGKKLSVQRAYDGGT